MTTPSEDRFARASQAHHDAIQSLLDGFRSHMQSVDELKAAKEAAEMELASSHDIIRDELSDYLEKMTDFIGEQRKEFFGD